MEKFGADKVITHHISNVDFSTYYVGFDVDDFGISKYRWRPLIDLLIDVIPEFAFGYHEGTKISITKPVSIVREAARAIYKIDCFNEVRNRYLKYNQNINDLEDKYLKRGEFGELILHLLLRDFHDTIPLLSKIYFKDSYGHTVHGFDAVHIQPDTKTLWLGESKLYSNGQNGIKELINDIKNHFIRDYLDDEFTIVSKKIKPYTNIPEKDYWLSLLDTKTKLKDQLMAINIPLLCTYTSTNFGKYSEESEKFIEDYENEVVRLKQYFDTHNDHPLKTQLNIILILFPVKCKNELVKRMHKELTLLSGGR
jgi:hypothetical protein